MITHYVVRARPILLLLLLLLHSCCSHCKGDWRGKWGRKEGKSRQNFFVYLLIVVVVVLLRLLELPFAPTVPRPAAAAGNSETVCCPLVFSRWLVCVCIRCWLEILWAVNMSSVVGTTNIPSTWLKTLAIDLLALTNRVYVVAPVQTDFSFEARRLPLSQFLHNCPVNPPPPLYVRPPLAAIFPLCYYSLLYTTWRMFRKSLAVCEAQLFFLLFSKKVLIPFNSKCGGGSIGRSYWDPVWEDGKSNGCNQIRYLSFLGSVSVLFINDRKNLLMMDRFSSLGNFHFSPAPIHRFFFQGRKYSFLSIMRCDVSRRVWFREKWFPP